MSSPLYGLLAEFESGARLVEAVRQARAAGYQRLEAFTPVPVEELTEVLPSGGNWLPGLALLGGLAGGAAAYAVQYYATVIDYPLNVGGRALHSWPAFLVVTFELTLLGAALAAVLGMLVLNRLPAWYHPVFHVPRFALASRDRFFLCITTADAQFDRVATRQLLDALQPCGVWEVPT